MHTDLKLVSLVVKHFGVPLLFVKGRSLPCPYKEVGSPPGGARIVQLPSGRESLFVDLPTDESTAGYLLHELAHLLTPGSTEDDEMRALVVQHLILEVLSSEFLRREFEDYGFWWELEPDAPFEWVQSGTIFSFDAFGDTVSYKAAFAELPLSLIEQIHTLQERIS